MAGEAPTATAGRRGRLATVLQDALTVTVRLRRGESVATDAVTFRNRLKTMLSTVTQQAGALGYGRDNVRLGVFGFTVFLDESVLASSDPMFREWARQPLQEEVFGEHTGGETFYTQLEGLLRRPDSEELSDVLEIFLLCLLLGFHGRYPPGGPQLEQITSAVSERIRRIRGEASSGAWMLPRTEALPRRRDRVTRALATASLAGVVGVVALYLVMRFSLSGGVDAVRTLAAGMGVG